MLQRGKDTSVLGTRRMICCEFEQGRPEYWRRHERLTRGSGDPEGGKMDCFSFIAAGHQRASSTDITSSRVGNAQRITRRIHAYWQKRAFGANGIGEQHETNLLSTMNLKLPGTPSLSRLPRHSPSQTNSSRSKSLSTRVGPGVPLAVSTLFRKLHQGLFSNSVAQADVFP
jgi:hypothetical protein